jgi:putative transposase
MRAGMGDHPRDYPWSSYRANAEMLDSTIVRPHDEYLALGATREEHCLAYRYHFRFELGPDDLKQIRSAGAGGYALGNPRFQAVVAAMAGRRVTRLRAPPALPLGDSPATKS